MKNFLLNLVLIMIALFLVATLGVVGFFFEIGFRAWRGGLIGVGNFFRTVAISLDQTGNAAAGILLSMLFLDRYSTDAVLFGNEDETVSSVLGKNKEKGSLNFLGRRLDALLHWLDPGHSIEAIERDE